MATFDYFDYLSSSYQPPVNSKPSKVESRGSILPDGAYKEWVQNGNFPCVDAPISKVKNGKYFLGLMQVDVHTFIVSGIESSEHTIILSRFGKAFVEENTISLQLRVKFGGSCASRIQTEGLLLMSDSKEDDVSYRYDLHHVSEKTHNRYIAFMHFLTKHSAEAKTETDEQGRRRILLGCYMLGESGNYKYKRLSEVNPEDLVDEDTTEVKEAADELTEKVNVLSMENTCRTTAVEIFSQFVELEEPIQSNYKVPLAGRAKLNRPEGLTVSSLSIMPERYIAQEDETTKNYVLTTLYTRMLELRKHRENSNKFRVLRQLYGNITKLDGNNIKQILKMLNCCLHTKSKILNSHRSIFGVGSTKTYKCMKALRDNIVAGCHAATDEIVDDFLVINTPSLQDDICNEGDLVTVSPE